MSQGPHPMRGHSRTAGLLLNETKGTPPCCDLTFPAPGRRGLLMRQARPGPPSSSSPLPEPSLHFRRSPHLVEARALCTLPLYDPRPTSAHVPGNLSSTNTESVVLPICIEGRSISARSWLSPKIRQGMFPGIARSPPPASQRPLCISGMTPKPGVTTQPSSRRSPVIAMHGCLYTAKQRQMLQHW